MGPKKKTIVGLLVFRVPGFLHSRPDWVPPHPHPQESVAPLWVQGGSHTRIRGGGGGGGALIPTMRQTLCYSRYAIIPLDSASIYIKKTYAGFILVKIKKKCN